MQLFTALSALCALFFLTSPTGAAANRLQQLDKELTQRTARQLQTFDCAAEPETECQAAAECQPEPAVCEPGVLVEPESMAECEARVANEPAAEEPAACEPEVPTGCTWIPQGPNGNSEPAACEPSAAAEPMSVCEPLAEP
eukprot:COSAG02_NODE_16075_length_1115_cov_1.205709_1_plen_140_part_10